MDGKDDKWLTEQLTALRAGRLSEEQLEDFIHEAGEADFRKAEPDIARLLSHPHPLVRSEAISTLGLHWRERAYTSVIEHMLGEDPDVDVRIGAAWALGSLFTGTGNRHVARLLARCVISDQEDMFVRVSAYEALRDIMLKPPQRGREFRERLATTPREEWENTLDWDLITKAAADEDASD